MQHTQVAENPIEKGRAAYFAQRQENEIDVVQEVREILRLSGFTKPALDLFVSNDGVGVNTPTVQATYDSARGGRISYEEADYADGLPFSSKLTMEANQKRNHQHPATRPRRYKNQ
jgi:hypothetical protein